MQLWHLLDEVAKHESEVSIAKVEFSGCCKGVPKKIGIARIPEESYKSKDKILGRSLCEESLFCV